MPDGKSESGLWPANKNWKMWGLNSYRGKSQFFLVVCVNFVVFVLECNKYTLCCANILSVPILRREQKDSKEVESFQQLLTARIQEFVEEVWPDSVLSSVEKFYLMIFIKSV